MIRFVLLGATEADMGTVESRVSEILGRKRWSIADLQREADIAYNTAWHLYHGKSKRIDLDVIARICQALDVEVGDLLVFVPEKRSPG